MKSYYRRFIAFCLLLTLVIVGSWSLGWNSPALAAIDDDRLDGNIFVVYAGNGSLVPPRIDLEESLKRKTPVILVYYLDDSKDCKQYAIVVSRFQEFYGRAASIIPVSVDSIFEQKSYNSSQPGYYYRGGIPQTVILDQNGKVVFDEIGNVPYEKVDDVLRKVFDLLPRDKSVTLKRRTFNEFNTELVQ
ncbi:MAG: thylakoid membrane photosystem I accumulation factor [Chlorogloea purpurea SAG 13.99]|nr:thylakoid membrane photosystem I accumulation factor [Chlorogloea purpurea SAG 13.99]